MAGRVLRTIHLAMSGIELMDVHHHYIQCLGRNWMRSQKTFKCFILLVWGIQRQDGFEFVIKNYMVMWRGVLCPEVWDKWNLGGVVWRESNGHSLPALLFHFEILCPSCNSGSRT